MGLFKKLKKQYLENPISKKKNMLQVCKNQERILLTV